MLRVRIGEDNCHCPICDFLAQAQETPPASTLGDLQLAVMDFVIESKQLLSTPAAACYFTRGPPETHFA